MSSVKEQPTDGWRAWHSDEVPLRIGVSGCMLGATVRYDGGHARDRFVTDQLGPWVEWVSVCPEVEVGMGVPRPTIRLVERDEPKPDGSKDQRLVAPSTGEDHTESMTRFAEERAQGLSELDGFIFKKSSPTCGLYRVKVYHENGHGAHKQGRGLFAQAMCTQYPWLPAEEDGRLNDARLREKFIERIFSRNRWRALIHKGLDRRALVAFHTAHKLIVRAHDEGSYQRLGRLVGSFGKRPDGEIFCAYEGEFHRALERMASRGRHVNVLQHALGYLKDLLGPREKTELLTAIEDYHAGLLPLVVPVTLLRMAIVHYEVEYLAGQLYFEPHPKELMLRNHV